MKFLVFSLCLALLTTFSAVNADARRPCGKVLIQGHYDRHGRWVPPRWKRLRWVPGHYNRAGRWVPGHCR
jgi:hypothetical protein